MTHTPPTQQRAAIATAALLASPYPATCTRSREGLHTTNRRLKMSPT